MGAPVDLNKDYSSYWDLANKTPLNHGSFGATPTEILKRLIKRQADFNRDRETFLWHELGPELAAAQATLAKFVGVSEEDLVLVDNITEGLNTVIRSLMFVPGEEVLVTSHLYSPYVAPLRDLAELHGFAVKTVDIPYPPRDEDEIVALIAAAANKNTKLAIIEHISSPTALIFPLKKIVAALKKKNVDCFIDGAHAPGQIPVNVSDIGAAYYSANNHKWMCAPVSSGFLYVRRDRQDKIVPVIASAPGHRDAPFAERFAWQGTKDVLPRLLVPDTLVYMAKMHPQGWEGIMARNHALAVAARDLMVEALRIPAPYPDYMFGSMFTLPLGPLQFDAKTMRLEPGKQFSAVLQKETGLRVYAMLFKGQYLLRLSAHLYNNIGHYKALAKVLPAFLLAHTVQEKKKANG